MPYKFHIGPFKVSHGQAKKREKDAQKAASRNPFLPSVPSTPPASPSSDPVLIQTKKNLEVVEKKLEEVKAIAKKTEQKLEVVESEKNQALEEKERAQLALQQAVADDKALEGCVQEYKELGTKVAEFYVEQKGFDRQKQESKGEILQYQNGVVTSQNAPQLSERQNFLLDNFAGSRMLYRTVAEDAFIWHLKERTIRFFRERNYAAVEALDRDVQRFTSTNVSTEEKAARLLVAISTSRHNHSVTPQNDQKDSPRQESRSEVQSDRSSNTVIHAGSSRYLLLNQRQAAPRVADETPGNPHEPGYEWVERAPNP